MPESLPADSRFLLPQSRGANGLQVRCRQYSVMRIWARVRRIPLMIASACFHAALAVTGLVFAQALAHKLRNPAGFARSVREYDLLPGPLAAAAAAVLILAELSALALIASAFAGIAGALLPGRLGLAAAGLLLALYGLAMGVNLARRKFGLDCGCTAGHTPISAGLVLRNFALAGLAAGAVLAGDFRPAGLPLGLPLGAALFLAWLTATRLTSNRMYGVLNRNSR